MSETEGLNASNEDVTQNDKSSKGRKAKGNRLSTIDRMKEEGEAILKGLGDVAEVEGRRRTRSSARGVPATPPPPAKKGKAGRGRPKKKANAKDAELDETDSQDEGKDTSSTADDSKAAASEPESENKSADEATPAENNAHGTPEKAAAPAADVNDKTAESEPSTENGGDKEPADQKSENSADAVVKSDSTEKMDTSEVCSKQNNAVDDACQKPIEKSAE